MRYERRKKAIILGLLLVVICSISIGFAAFSSNLIINPTATVTPDPGDFSVKFSSSSAELATDPVAPSSKTSGIDTTDATITNDGTPTISGYSATFTEDGQYVTYSFYVRNTGNYTAYLNSITFLGSKNCIPISGTSNTSVNSNCGNVNTATTVKVGNIIVTDTTLDITGETLSPGESKLVEVTFEYLGGGSAIDGDFSIFFNAVSLYYSSAAGKNENTEAICTLTDTDNDNVADTGEVVTCGTENFYVVENNGTNIQMLTKYNLSLTRPYLQDPTDTTYPSKNPIVFSNTNYWTSNVTEYTAYVYNNNSNLYQIIEGYVSYLNSIGVSEVTGKLLSHEQAMALGCTVSPYTCESAPAWVYSTNYWLGSAYNSRTVWRVHASDGYGSVTYDLSNYGVRPVITIPVSNIA